MFDGSYGPYVLSAYVFAAVVLFALVWSTLWTARRVQRDLDGADTRRRRK
ncbi:MAG: heme exporter protein CcmD [Pseudomonadota bacterium]